MHQFRISRTVPTVLALALIGPACDDDVRQTPQDGATTADKGSAQLDTGGPQSDKGAPQSDQGAPQPDKGTPGVGKLPEGNTGVAANHPDDVGIAKDPAVIFADDFEGHANVSSLSNKWDVVHHTAQIRIATEAANVFTGAKALEFKVPKQTAELSNTAAKLLGTEREILFLRYHSKFDSGFDVTGSSHNGGGISAHYYVNGQATPGVPADGTNKFLANLENWRADTSVANPGQLNVYIYHPEQRSKWGDHFFPSGKVLPNSSIPHTFGPTFVARKDLVPDLGRWYSYELMVKANTVGKRDGRIACWLDGKLVADFPNLRLRDVKTLKIDRFSISLHIGSNTKAVARKWYDNVVAATSYIGPVFKK